jgi:prepilin-type N-terminal cleavage/methylation domain-containing protein
MTGSDRQQRTLNVTHISDRNSRALGGAAFTLVELLVVIVVISLLAAIVAPAMNMATRKAKQHECRNRLKSLHGGAAAYGAENRNLVPIVHEGSTSKGTVGKLLASGGRFASKYLEQSWTGEGSSSPGKYATMARINNIFQCPAALEYPDPAGNSKTEGTNYNLSGFGVYTGGSGLKPDGMHPSMQTISGTVQSSKKNPIHPSGEVAMAVDWIEMRGISNNQSQVNHKDGVNVLFGSGSAKWFGYGSLLRIGSTNMLRAPGTYGFVKGGSTGVYAPCTHVIDDGGTARSSAAGVMW